MSIKETVILEFVSDDDALNASIDRVGGLTDADQKLTDKLKQSSSAFQERTKAVDQATKSQSEFNKSADGSIRAAEGLSRAIKASLGNLGKGALKELSFDIRRAIVEELQRAGVSVRQFKTLWNQQFGETKKTTRSLAQELRLAKQELARLADTPGVDPLQLKAAAIRAAELDDKIGDINNTIKAFDPDTKLASLNAFGAGLIGTFNTAQGSLQAFGVQSDLISSLLSKFAGLLNFSQGITQIAQLKDGWSNVKLSLEGASEEASNLIDSFKGTGEIATDAKNTADASLLAKGAIDKLKGAKLADAAASETAAAANTALGLSMPVIAVSALVVGMGALVAYLIKTGEETDQTAEAFQRLFDKKQQSRELESSLADIITQLQVARGEITNLDAQIIKSARDEAKVLGDLFVQRDNLNKKINEQRSLLEQATRSLQTAAALEKEGQAGAAAAARAQNAERKKVLEANIAALTAERAQLLENIRLVGEQGKRERDLFRQLDKNAKDKKKFDEDDKEREQDIVDAIKTRTGNEERALQLAIVSLNLSKEQKDALRELGFEGIKLSDTYLTLNDTQIQALSALNEYAKGSYEALRNFFKQATEELKKEADVMGVVVKQTSLDLKHEEEEQAESLRRLIADILDGLSQISDSMFRINQINLDAALDKQVQFFEGKKESEIKNKRLTEEQKQKIEEKYARKIAEAREDAAKKQRKAELIQMAINQALSIGKLAAENPPPQPAFFIGLAVIIATFAAQLAEIRRQPLPQYRDGVEMVEGPGTTTSDSILARLSKKERVVDAATNIEYFPALSAIHHKKVPAEAINEFAQNYGRNFEVTKVIQHTGATMSEDSLARKMAYQFQLGIAGAFGPSEYDKQSTEYLRTIAEAVSRGTGKENIRRSRS